MNVMTKKKKNIKPYTKNAFPVKKVRQGVLQYEGGMMEERKPDFEIGFEGDSSFSGYGHVTNGSAGIVEEINAQDINLKSFNVKNKLNPLFWKNNTFNKQVRLKLLDIVDEFIKDLQIKDLKIEDIILTGSLANYNWSKKYSDIDLHIVIDMNATGVNTEIVKQYFDSQRKIWNIDHKSMKILGYPIEVYVQDINEPHKSSGIYSLMKDKWIIKPEKREMNKIEINDELIKQRVSNYINLIDKGEKIFNKIKTDNVKLEKLLSKLDKLYNKIKNERKNSLSSKDGNELSDGNIIFKAMRRSNYIEKLIILRKKIKNIINSL